MSIRFSRRQPRHALAPVSTAEETPARPEVTEGPDLADITLTDKPLDVLRPAAVRTKDETVLFRIPGGDGGPGFVIPTGAPWQAAPETRPQADPEDALPVRSPGDIIPAASVPALRTEPADPDMLRDVLDGLQALPDEDTDPAAYLRAVVPGGDTGVTQIQDTLGHSPRFAGSGLLADGRPVAGMYLGTNEDGWFVVDALTPEWCADAIAALEEMRDALLASERAEDGEAA